MSRRQKIQTNLVGCIVTPNEDHYHRFAGLDWEKRMEERWDGNKDGEIVSVYMGDDGEPAYTVLLRTGILQEMSRREVKLVRDLAAWPERSSL